MKKRISVLVINSLFLDARVLKFSKTLSKKYEVSVICLHDESIEDQSLIYDFEIHRIKISTNKLGKGLIQNFIKYFEYFFKALKLCHSSDFIHANDLPTLPIAILSKFLKPKKVIYDAHEWEIDFGKTSKLKNFLSWVVERSMIHFADKYITVSKLISKEYEKVYGIPHFNVIMNVPNYETPKKNCYLREKFDISESCKIYVIPGLLSLGRDLENIIETFTTNKNMYMHHLVLMGYGPMVNKIKFTANTNDNIHFHEAVPEYSLVETVSSADYGIVGSQALSLSYNFAMPNKLFTYLMAEIPIICADLPEMGGFTKKFGIGNTYTPEDSSSLFEAIRNINSSDRSVYVRKLQECKKIINWEAEEKKIYEIYSNK